MDLKNQYTQERMKMKMKDKMEDKLKQEHMKELKLKEETEAASKKSVS